MSEPAAVDLASKEQQAPPKGALLTIFLIVFIDLMGFGLIIPLMPYYARTFKASDLQVTLLFSVYSICQFVAAPILGVISDRYGRRPVLFFSQIGSVIGFILLGYASNWSGPNLVFGLMLLYLARVIDGLSGGNISTAQAYISDVTTAENRAKGMGLLGAAFGLGFVLGPGLAALLIHLFHNEAMPAYAAAGFSAVAAIMTYLYLPESRTHKPVDAEAWLHPRVFLPLLKKPVLMQLNGIWFLAMAAYVMIDSTIVLYLADIFKFDATKSGMYFVYVGLIIAFVQGGLIRRLLKHGGEWGWSGVGLLMVAVGYVVTLYTAWDTAQWLLIFGGAIYATGRSIQQPTIQSLVSKNSEPSEQGTSFGLFQGTGTIARVVGPIVAGPVYTRHPIGPFIVATVLVIIAGVWTLALGKSAARE